MFDLVVIGAGAAGLQCAAMAGQRGLSVLLIEHAETIAEKIRISGGGRCNFTNREVGPAHFFSANPPFCRSALARYTPQDFIDLVEKHGIAWHEKHKGQLFCDGSSRQIVSMLLQECADGAVEVRQPCSVDAVEHRDGRFELQTSCGPVSAARLVVATGGLSIPKIGATDFGHRLAWQFGHRVVEPRPALVPLTFDGEEWSPFSALAGLALPVTVSVTVADGRSTDEVEFTDDLLFTHRGLSGPAALQISTAWRPGAPLRIDCAPGADLASELLASKQSAPRRSLGQTLAETLPKRLRDAVIGRAAMRDEQTLADTRDRDLAAIARSMQPWSATPSGTEGYRKAEVTSGGVDTRELDSKTMQSKRVAGLHFVGEVVDVTGWLGGYNFQWAWASAAACAGSMGAPPLVR